MHRALSFFLPFLGGQHVRSDNVSAVPHINHQGGTRSARLWQASRGPPVVGSTTPGQPESNVFTWGTESGCRLTLPLQADAGGVADSSGGGFPPIPSIFPTLHRVLQQGHRLLLASLWPTPSGQGEHGFHCCAGSVAAL